MEINVKLVNQFRILVSCFSVEFIEEKSSSFARVIGLPNTTRYLFTYKEQSREEGGLNNLLLSLEYLVPSK